MLPFEIKSGQTCKSGLWTGLNKWAHYSGDAGLPAQALPA
jgi:hypothetical protein